MHPESTPAMCVAVASATAAARSAEETDIAKLRWYRDLVINLAFFKRDLENEENQ